jgi:hypothetical protein
MTMRKTALLAGLLAVILVACGGRDFNRPSLLDRPRILAVRAEPPQPSFGQSPTPGPTRYQWEWCPMPMVTNQEQNTAVCPFPEEAFQALYAGLGLGAAPSYQLGEGETMTFTNPFPATLLYALCRGDIGTSLGGPPSGGSSGAGQSVFSCDRPADDIKAGPNSEFHPIGFAITIKVTITPACPSLLPDGFSPLVATYALHLPTNDAIPVNQNPVLSGIFVTENWTDVLDGGAPPGSQDVSDGGVPPDDGGVPFDGGVPSDDGGIPANDGGVPVAVDGGVEIARDAGHDAPDGAVPLEEDPVVRVKRDKHVGLQLDIDINTAEHLAVPGSVDYDSKTGDTRHYEHLQFTWYAEAGNFTGRGKGRNTAYVPTALPQDQDTPPSDQDIANFQFNTTNTWDAPKHEDYGYDTARIIVVVRDGRGGVDWTSKQVSLEALP